MKRINSDPDGREPDWDGLERLVRVALASFKLTERPDRVALVAQIDTANIDEIDFTGHGFYATVSLPKIGPTLWAPFGPLSGIAMGGNELISLLLWLDKSGRIICLEGANCGDAMFTGAQDYVVDVSAPGQ